MSAEISIKTIENKHCERKGTLTVNGFNVFCARFLCGGMDDDGCGIGSNDSKNPAEAGWGFPSFIQSSCKWTLHHSTDRKRKDTFHRRKLRFLRSKRMNRVFPTTNTPFHQGLL